MSSFSFDPFIVQIKPRKHSNEPVRYQEESSPLPVCLLGFMVDSVVSYTLVVPNSCTIKVIVELELSRPLQGTYQTSASV